MELKTNNPVLQFQTDAETISKSLSAALLIEDHLWVASDETTSVERLQTEDGITFGHHKSFSLSNFLQLPAQDTEFDQEIDIEGMDFDGTYLWVIGSHSIKRKKIDRSDPGSFEKKIKKLAKTEGQGNRFILARIPLVRDETGDQILVQSDLGAGHHRNAAQLRGDTVSSELTDVIKAAELGQGDLHLSKFLSLPGKDNGFDIEGLAVRHDRIFVGLRGPVLRGWAMILELAVESSEPAKLELKPIGPAVRKYKKHFLELQGLGIRDLCIDDDDILILAGPTMNLDGPARVYRWKGGLISSAVEEQCVFSDDLSRLVEVPFGDGDDHAEGMTLIKSSNNASKLLIVYDSPSPQRIVGPSAIIADVFDLPSAVIV